MVIGTAEAAAGADAVGVSGSWGPWGEGRHGEMRWDLDARKQT